jgi:hypothetical protein
MVLIDKFMNHANIVAHHLLSLFIVTIICMIIFIVSLIMFNNQIKKEKGNPNIKEMEDAINHCYIYIIIYIICYISFCFGLNIQKKIMDQKFIHPYKILFCKGIIGLFFSIIALIISTQIYCKEKHEISDNESDKGEDFFFLNCHIDFNSFEYLDNFYSYITNFSQPFNENQVLEIFFIILFLVFYYFSRIFLIMINKNLSSMHCLIGISFFQIFHSIKKMFDEDEDGINSKKVTPNGYENITTIILRNISYIIIVIIGYLIYLEIIIFKCCGLSENIRKEIDERAKIEEEIIKVDTNGIEDFNSDNISSEY